jgi:hypothetical protein
MKLLTLIVLFLITTYSIAKSLVRSRNLEKVILKNVKILNRHANSVELFVEGEYNFHLRINTHNVVLVDQLSYPSQCSSYKADNGTRMYVVNCSFHRRLFNFKFSDEKVVMKILIEVMGKFSIEASFNFKDVKQKDLFNQTAELIDKYISLAKLAKERKEKLMKELEDSVDKFVYSKGYLQIIEVLKKENTADGYIAELETFLHGGADTLYLKLKSSEESGNLEDTRQKIISRLYEKIKNIK